jgi:hypothetical protein
MKRISADIYQATRMVLKIFLQKVVGDAVIYTEHGTYIATLAFRECPLQIVIVD